MIISQTPLRISFAGGGTDIRSFYSIEGGAVVNAAIDKYIYVIVKERYDRKIYINYSKKEIVDDVDDIQHDLVREAMKMTGVLEGVEITTLADIPSEGTGLGSSSSVTVGLLTALSAYRGETEPAGSIAEKACEIEIDIIGKPIGKQDQYIAAFGGLHYFGFDRGGKVDVRPIKLDNDGRRAVSKNLMLFYSNRTRRADPILHEQIKGTNDKRNTLKSLRQLADETHEAFTSGRYDQLGDILDRGWNLKMKLAGPISNGDINAMYESALSAGAGGGKLCGAGGGGFLLLYCEPEYQNGVQKALEGYAELPFNFCRYGSRIIFHIAP